MAQDTERGVRHLLNRLKALPPVVWISVILAAFWASTLVLDFFTLHEIVSALYIGVALAVLAVFGWTALIALFTVGGLDRAQQVALGIALAWMGNEMHRIYHLWWRSLGEPLDIINRNIVTSFLVVTLVGGILHITVPDTHTGIVPRVSWLVLGVALAVGAAVAGFVIGLNWSSSVHL